MPVYFFHHLLILILQKTQYRQASLWQEKSLFIFNQAALSLKKVKLPSR